VTLARAKIVLRGCQTALAEHRRSSQHYPGVTEKGRARPIEQAVKGRKPDAIVAPLKVRGAILSPTEARLPNPERWLTLNDVVRATSLARSTLYDLIRDTRFPAPVKIGRLSRWPEGDVMDWMARKHAERPASRAA